MVIVLDPVPATPRQAVHAADPPSAGTQQDCMPDAVRLDAFAGPLVPDVPPHARREVDDRANLSEERHHHAGCPDRAIAPEARVLDNTSGDASLSPPGEANRAAGVPARAGSAAGLSPTMGQDQTRDPLAAMLPASPIGVRPLFLLRVPFPHPRAACFNASAC
jgi:hypothetical protein